MAAIDFVCKTAFNYFEDFSSNKMYHMARPLLKATDAITMTMNVDYDFKGADQAGIVNIPAGNESAARFDVALFDVATFAGDSLYFNDWISINGMGFCAAFQLSGSAENAGFEWYNWAITYEPGGVL